MPPSSSRALLLALLLIAEARAGKHCPHECPASAHVIGSDFIDCGGSSHCGDCDACLYMAQAKAEAARKKAEREAALKAAEEAAALALIADTIPPPPPPPTPSERDIQFRGECNTKACRKADQCQTFACHACPYCAEQIPNFVERSIPCNGGPPDHYKFCANWCNAGRHHCTRCECQTCEFCDWEDDQAAWSKAAA